MKVVWFSEIKWSYLKTRKQQIIERFPDDWEILFIESYVSGKSNHFLPCKEGRIVHATIPFFKSTPSRLVNAVQNNIIFRFCFQIVAFFWVKILLRVSGFYQSDRIICISNVYYANIIKLLKKKLIVYDCNDVPMGFSSKLNFTETYFKITLQISDLIITVSKQLADRIQQFGKTDVSLIGNGVDFNLFSLHQAHPPPDIESIPKPRIVYAGALADWFDVDLLMKISEKYPGFSIILIGPFLSAPVKKRIETASLKNLHVLGVKAYQDLPAYYAASDVCIIPFRKNELTTGLNPNKLYEYLAMGKPVVTRDFSDEIEALSGEIFVAKNDDEFISMIEKAVHTAVNKERLQAVARENSWKNKSQQFVNLINNALAEKKQAISEKII